MMWLRKGIVHLLSLMLFVSLIGLALSVSSNLALTHPNKVENWLNQSNLYQNFVSNTISQAIKAAGSSENQGSVTLSDTAVQQAANSTFTTVLFQRNVNTFLDSNYAWLEGKTQQPNFIIDLTQAKSNFASQVGQYVQDHISSLPVCTARQLVAIGSASSVDPLNITCRPAGLDVKAEASLVSQKIENSGDFLTNPVITANNINPNGGSQSQPYYQKFSYAPQLYKLAVKLPWIYALIALLCAGGIIFVALRKRLGLRRVAVVLAVSGLFLIVVRSIAGVVLAHLEKNIFNSANVGQLQQSLTNFMNLAEKQLVRVDLLFGIGYLLLAAIILIFLRPTRHRPPKPSSPPAPQSPETSIADRLRNDMPPPPAKPPETPRPVPQGPPPRPKRRRLVQ